MSVETAPTDACDATAAQHPTADAAQSICRIALLDRHPARFNTIEFGDSDREGKLIHPSLVVNVDQSMSDDCFHNLKRMVLSAYSHPRLPTCTTDVVPSRPFDA